MRSTIQGLLDAIHDDRAHLTRHAQKLRQAELTVESSEERCAFVSLQLHSIYTLAEAIFRRIARALNEPQPTGDSWHTDLLAAMAIPVEGLRPAVLSEESAKDLATLLAFRHFLVHGSVRIDPDAERLLDVRDAALRAEEALREDLDRFEGYLNSLIASSD